MHSFKLLCLFFISYFRLSYVYFDDEPMFTEDDEILKGTIERIESLYQVRKLGPSLVSYKFSLNLKVIL